LDVCIGNSEIFLASLSQGIPMVIVPSMLDQPEMSWRVSDSGAGVRLSVRRCSPARMREAVTLVMSDPRFRKNAAKLGSQLAQRGGAKRAAELLEGLVT
jgi:zeaxanthin glucosyltransferase